MRDSGRPVLIFLAPILWAQANQLTDAQKAANERRDYIKANYTKNEFLIPMRDGTRLFTSVYTPKNLSEPFPIMLNRTPYTVAPYGIDNYRVNLGPSEKFFREGFIFAYQDVRGKGRSEGKYVHVRPYIPNKKPTATSMNRATLTTPSTGW